MAYEDYLPGGKKDPNAQAGGIEDEINAAGTQQQARVNNPIPGDLTATPENVDWEKRFHDLEKHNSRQAQDLGTYRKMVDDYIINTPTPEEPVVAEPVPITVDELYDNLTKRSPERLSHIQRSERQSRSLRMLGSENWRTK